MEWVTAGGSRHSATGGFVGSYIARGGQPTRTRTTRNRESRTTNPSNAWKDPTNQELQSALFRSRFWPSSVWTNSAVAVLFALLPWLAGHPRQPLSSRSMPTTMKAALATTICYGLTTTVAWCCTLVAPATRTGMGTFRNSAKEWPASTSTTMGFGTCKSMWCWLKPTKAGEDSTVRGARSQ